jgi:NADH-quinone oxidoreductase subunit L
MLNVLTTLFPTGDFTLLAVIMGMPLLGAIVNGIWGQRLGKQAVRTMALAAMAFSFAAALLTFLVLDREASHHPGEHVRLSWLAWEWMHTTGGREISVPIQLKFSVDALSGVMMLVITGVGFLIHLYASSYMENDKAYWRFFAYLNLFVFSMLVLVLGDNLPVLFVGWEGVGLCSYLLIGFWYQHAPNAAAGKKAFIANRIGDFGLICAMFLLVHYTGALDWQGIEGGSGSLVSQADPMQVHLWPIGGGQFQGALSFLQPKNPLMITGATAVGLTLFLGCTGKSAQVPLYVWLPDAMAGPTPVSALIHAATMVTAGIYLVCRLSFVFVLSPFTMAVIAFTGAFTALFAATIALVQNDLKKVLAYSTVSQLGYMFLGVGVGAFTAGFFHVLTHAFFKACLFLGAGSVIHAMHARIHDDAKSQDMRNMGGLRKYMPYTFWTFGAATIAIIGFPLTSGFFSKDEILFKAFVNHPVNPAAAHMPAKAAAAIWQQPAWIGPVVWAMGLAAAVLTAFYMSRAFILTFFGDFKGWTIGKPSSPSHHDAHDDHGHDDDDEHHHEEDLKKPGLAPHESPWQMTVPLMILGTLSLAGGFLNPALFAGMFKDKKPPMDHWLEPVFEEASKAIQVLPDAEAAHHKEYPLTAAAFAAFAIGTFVAYQFYIVKKGAPAKDMAEKAPGLYKLLSDKWRVDELYDATVFNGVDALADTAISVDQGFFDAIIARLTALIVAALGTVLRVFQNGVVHVYAGAMAFGIALIGWFVIVPRADVTMTESASGDYVLEAAPGVGYSYRWTPEAGGKAQDEKFSPTSTQLKVHLDADKTQIVQLEVKNAFGLEATRTVTLTRPAPEKPPADKLGAVDLPTNVGKN